MPISVVLTDEDGGEVKRFEDSDDALHRLLPSADDHSYHYLRFIDWYGDTVFNKLQMEPFLDEWGRLEALARTEDKEFFYQISELARQCQREQHLYLKFEGD